VRVRRWAEEKRREEKRKRGRNNCETTIDVTSL
jgi:hypothetical protein